MSVLSELVLPLLEAIKPSGAGYMARCPVHDDGSASLALREGKDHPVVFHCLAGETRVITKEGTREIAALAGGVHELLVPAVGGGPAQWQKCPVEPFGVQKLWRITLRRHSAEKVIYATKGHRWFTQRRGSAPKKEVTTGELKLGDRLVSILPRRQVRTVSSFGVAHGFVFGDGTVTARGLECQAQFCGPKDEALLPYFPNMEVREYEYQPGVKRIGGMPRFFKRAPDITESPAYLAGWLAGYFAADGSIEGHCAAISSASRDALESVRDVCTRLGIVTYPIRQQSRQGYGTDPRDLFKVALRGADLWPEFFVLPSHREKWTAGQSEHSRESWVVNSVESTDREEEVYCATVEGSHAFALEDFILTGNCHAGCRPDDIIAALNLSWDDLTKPREQVDDRYRQPRQSGQTFASGGFVAQYDYTDEAGATLFQVLRSADKKFRQRRPDPDSAGKWLWSLGDTRRVLYRLPELIQAVRDGQIVYVAEGEKDVENLRKQGFAATCNSGGAGKWRPEYAEFLREAVVTICADKDEPGQAHARQVRDSLLEVGATVEIAEAKTGKDVSDHLSAGLGLEEMEVTWTNDRPPKVDLAPDLDEFLAIEDDPYDWLIPDLLERGDRVLFTGFEGLGKTMVSRQIGIAIAAGVHPFKHHIKIPPQRVLVIDCENTERQNRRKYREMRSAAHAEGKQVDRGMWRIIHRIDGLDLTSAKDAEWLMERVTAHDPAMLIIGPFYKLHDADMNDEKSARKAISVLDKVRATVNCCLLIEAHSGHGDDPTKRSVRPIGSSLLMRWPEFGIGITPCGTAETGGVNSTVEVKHWRGQRDKRDWPRWLTYGDPGRWPWKMALGNPQQAKEQAKGKWLVQGGRDQ